jgi:hypothetical protein
MMQNKFLQDFMRTQNQILQLEAVDKTVKKDKHGVRKSKYGTKDGKKPLSDEEPFMTLVREKPPKKEILDYFRTRISELVAEDMK